MGMSPNGKAGACKAPIVGSIPTIPYFLLRRGGGIGRHKGLKIPRAFSPYGFDSRPRQNKGCP